MKSPTEYFLSLIPSHTHPQYGLMVLYPISLPLAVLCVVYYSSLFIDWGEQPITVAQNTYNVLKTSDQIIIP